VATVCTSFLVLVFGEIVPRRSASETPSGGRCGSHPRSDWSSASSSPLITLFDGITRRMNAYISGDANIEKPYTD